jgi:ABC-type transport system involved in cytochrome c biogenesis permease subunit
MTFSMIKDRFLLIATGIGFAALMFVVFPLITGYTDIIFTVFFVVMFLADRQEINRLRAEVKQLKSKLK